MIARRTDRKRAQRWFISYADIVSLLLVFFVFLFSLSTIERGKLHKTVEAFRQGSGLLPGTENMTSERLHEIEKMFASEIQEGGVNVTLDEKEIVLTFKERVSFDSGSDWIKPHFGDMLQKLTPLLKKTEGMIIISGHTDNVPIHNERFISNWALSAGRAVAVVHYLMDQGIDPSRLNAEAHADARPVGSNQTEEGRAENRRVEIKIISG